MEYQNIVRNLEAKIEKGMGNRGQALGLADMPQAFVMLGIGVFAIVLVAVMVQSVQTTQNDLSATGCSAGANCTAAFNISAQGLTAFTNAGTLLPILGLSVIAVVVIGVLFLIFRQ